MQGDPNTAMRKARFLYKLGMGLTIGGGALLIIGAIVAAVSAASVVNDCLFDPDPNCTTGHTSGYFAGVAMAVIGTIGILVGIPVWIVGAIKVSQARRMHAQMPYDPMHEKSFRASVTPSPAGKHMFNYALKF